MVFLRTLQDPTVGLCLGSWGSPRGVCVFLWARYPCRYNAMFLRIVYRLIPRIGAFAKSRCGPLDGADGKMNDMRSQAASPATLLTGGTILVLNRQFCDSARGPSYVKNSLSQLAQSRNCVRSSYTFSSLCVISTIH